ncbi:MAG TPA: glycosyltransferase family 4 protein [Actinomycetota bacterium]|nr:glycosyltransferase family 4 protein [Actinomycetota bacterium]
MRVVHVAPTRFGPGGLLGGGERYPLELARALATVVPCELVTFGPRPHRRLDRSGLRVRELRPLLHLGGHPAHPIARGLAGALADADVIHVHHPRSAPSFGAALLAHLGGRAAVATDHGAGGAPTSLLPRALDLFLPVSRHSAWLLGFPPARVRVIWGGADPTRFRPDPTLVRRGILFVGRITPHKGIDVLIRALPPGSTLLVAGTTGHDRRLPERGYPSVLRRLAAGRDVRFLGPVTEAELPELYRRAAVVVLPSVHRTCFGRTVRVPELLGLAAIEGMASGTPVVCSRVGGLPEVVEHGGTGFLVEPGDVEALRDRLRRLLGEPRTAARMGAEARAVAVERFTWGACAERCLAAYEELRPNAVR